MGSGNGDKVSDRIAIGHALLIAKLPASQQPVAHLRKNSDENEPRSGNGLKKRSWQLPYGTAFLQPFSKALLHLSKKPSCSRSFASSSRVYSSRKCCKLPNVTEWKLTQILAHRNAIC